MDTAAERYAAALHLIRIYDKLSLLNQVNLEIDLHEWYCVSNAQKRYDNLTLRARAYNPHFRIRVTE